MLAMLCANPAAMNVVASKTTPSSLSMIVRPARSQGSPERWPGCIARTTHGTGDRAWRRPRPPPTPQTRSPPAPPAAAVDHSHDDSAPASLPRRIWQNPPAPPELQLRGGSPDRRADQKAVWTGLLPHLPWRRTDSPGVEAGHRSPPSLPAKRERASCQTLLEGGAVDDVAAAGLDVAVVGVLDDRDPLEPQSPKPSQPRVPVIPWYSRSPDRYSRTPARSISSVPSPRREAAWIASRRIAAAS